MACSKLNLLAIPKRKEFLCNFIAPKGYEVAQFDISSVEPCVLTQLSQDASLLKIYGPESKHQCVYLYTAYFIPSLSRVRDLYNLDGYDTADELAEVKNKLYVERTYTKPIKLAWDYNQTSEGLAISAGMPLHEARSITEALNKAIPGRLQLQGALLKKLRENNGHIINGRGRPICVPKHKEKDIVNTICQGLGHDCLKRILWHMQLYRKKHKIEMIAYRPDWHDENLSLIRPFERKRFIEMVDHSFDELNRELDWSIEIKHGGCKFGRDMSVRCEDYV